MNSWPRSILRLSGRQPEPAPERKSEPPPMAVIRRFFATLARLDRRSRDNGPSDPEHRP